MNEDIPILLVEDNEDDVFALKWAVKKAQIPNPVHLASDGQKAIDYLAAIGGINPRPLLVLLDLKLPYKSGIEVLTWIRQQPNLAEIPVVILSGSDEARDHKATSELGAKAYLVKPPSPEDLLKVLALSAQPA